MIEQYAERLHTVRAWAAAVAAASLGLCAVVMLLRPFIVGPLTEAAFRGNLPGLLNAPLNEPNMAGYGTLEAYARLASNGVAIGCVVLLVIAGAFAAVALRPGNALAAARFLPKFGYALFCVVCALCTTFMLNKIGYWGSWYPLNDALNLEVGPPYRHRILLPLLAQGVGKLMPFVRPQGLYLISQFLVLLALFPVMVCWLSLFASRSVAMPAALLTLALLVLMQSYFTFYDLGIVLCFTLGFYLLATRRLAAYLALIAVATLNHELIMFLILVSGWLVQPWRQGARYDWRFVGAQLVLHGLVRLALFIAMPAERASSLGNVWINLRFLTEMVAHPHALTPTAVLVMWYVVAAFGLPHAPVFLRRATVLLALLLASTMFVGQLNEARQFAAFAPVAVALTACWWNAQRSQ